MPPLPLTPRAYTFSRRRRDGPSGRSPPAQKEGGDRRRTPAPPPIFPQAPFGREKQCGERTLDNAPEATSHSRTVLSSEPEASVRPSADHATLVT